MEKNASRASWALPLFLCLTAACTLSAVLKYDVIWDFVNYHYYNGFAFLNGRLNYDIAPAFLNTFFNPLLDVVNYLLTEKFNTQPTVFHFILGLPFGFVLYFLYRTARLFFDAGTLKGRVCVAAVLLIGTTGFATFFQIGSTTGEMPLAALILAAFFLLVRDIGFERRYSARTFLLAGFLLGAGAGLKMTGLLYCLSTGITLLLFVRRFERPWTLLGIFILGGAAGFLLFNGFWMKTLWENYGNPVFPFANAVFKSPYFDPVNYSDQTHLAGRSFFEELLLPFALLIHVKEAPAVGYADISDIRFALGFIIGLLFLFSLRRKKNRVETPTGVLFLAVWLVVSYILWLTLFSIIRYAVPIEALLAIALVKALASFRRPESMIGEALYFSFLLFITGIMLLTPYQSEPWGTRRGAQYVLDAETIVPPPGTLIYQFGAPTSAFIARTAQEQPDVRSIGFIKADDLVPLQHWDITDRGRFREIRDELTETHKGPRLAFLQSDSLFFLNPPELLKGMTCRPLRRMQDGKVSPNLLWPYTNVCFSEELKDRLK